MKILYFDIETTPILGHVWRVYDDSLLNIVKDTSLLMFAFAINDKPVEIVSGREFSEKQMAKKLWNLFNEADIIVGQNSDKFDIRYVNRLFIKYKFTPPAPYRTVDTLKIAKKYFRFSSNKLDDLGQFLLGRGKIQVDKNLWFACMDGDEKAFRKMERYCKLDVALTREVYELLKSWHTGHPNSNLYNHTTHNCPVCGKSTQKRGYTYTRVGKYQRYQCTSCGAWSKGERIITEKVIS
jgi:DNA polymerase elongation subunit (family B)/predicted RNA-binding Zn-ribbon protein involved in translation (DUF1610 family)